MALTPRMEILVLGGTAFLGRAIAGAAARDGHAVTCAARGTTPAPEEATFRTVDRDAEDGLKPVSDQIWDAVIDVSRHPGQVRRAVRDVQTRHRVFISSLNVYATFDRPEQAEDAPLVPPLGGDVMEDMSMYGAAKVACEEIIRGAGTTATIIRSGLIAGPGDWSGRSGYYPWRFAHPTGADVLVPDDPGFPCARGGRHPHRPRRARRRRRCTGRGGCLHRRIPGGTGIRSGHRPQPGSGVHHRRARLHAERSVRLPCEGRRRRESAASPPLSEGVT